MISRTAFTQLRYSPLLLAGTVLGLAFVYLAAGGVDHRRPTVRRSGMAADVDLLLAGAPFLRAQPAVGAAAAADRGVLYGVHGRIAIQHWRGRRRQLEGANSAARLTGARRRNSLGD